MWVCVCLYAVFLASLLKITTWVPAAAMTQMGFNTVTTRCQGVTPLQTAACFTHIWSGHTEQWTLSCSAKSKLSKTRTTSEELIGICSLCIPPPRVCATEDGEVNMLQKRQLGVVRAAWAVPPPFAVVTVTLVTIVALNLCRLYNLTQRWLE